jgi:hypothetical protein
MGWNRMQETGSKVRVQVPFECIRAFGDSYHSPGRRHHDNTMTVAMRPVRAHLHITNPTCIDKQETELFYWTDACMMHASMRGQGA